MLEWIETVFSTSSDIARFVTVVFSAVVAVLILILNQYFINKRERRSLIANKVEEIYEHILKFQKYGAEFLMQSSHHNVFGEMHNEKELYQITTNNAQSITMLLELYFQHEKIASEEIEKTLKTLRYQLEYSAKEGDTSFETELEVMDEFEARVQKLKDICKRISKKNSHA